MKNIKVSVYDGKEHPVDSKPVAFEIAGREAFKLAVKDSSPVLLEPIIKLKVTVPDNYTGDIMSDLNNKRGRVMGIYSLTFFGFLPVGALWVGTMAEHFGEPAAVLINAGIMLLLCAAIALYIPGVRRLK
jgi:translation elongation factor EF-G